MAYSDNSFDAVWEELRKGNPELIDKVDQRVAEILSREKQRGCPPDCNPGFCDDPDEEICGRCWANWEKRKLPITNGDRTRSMSDEELADWVWGAETAGRAYGPRGKKAWLDWLKEEADDGTGKK